VNLKLTKIFVLCSVPLLLCISCSGRNKKKGQEAETPPRYEEHVSGEYIVTLGSAKDGVLLQNILSPHKAVSIEKITDTVFLVRLERELTPSEIQAYLENGAIEAIQPNFIYRTETEERLQAGQKE
jgi:hypothetical protein